MQRRLTASSVMKGATFVAALLAVAGIVAMLGADAEVARIGQTVPLWWLVGIATAAIVGALAWVLMDGRGGEQQPRETPRQCPWCGRGILRPWRMCPYCGGMIESDEAGDEPVTAV